MTPVRSSTGTTDRKLMRHACKGFDLESRFRITHDRDGGGGHTPTVGQTYAWHGVHAGRAALPG